MDDATIAVLLKEKDRHLRLAAGIPDDAEVDLSLIRLPKSALMFPSLSVSFTKPLWPRNFSRAFADRTAKLSFGRTRFHDLRGIHATALLDAGIPVHTVAQRIGDDDPAVLPKELHQAEAFEAGDRKALKCHHGLRGRASWHASLRMLANRLASADGSARATGLSD